RDERREQLPLRLGPLRRPLHHLLEQLGEGPAEEVAAVAERARDVGDVPVALLELADLRGALGIVLECEPHASARSAARRRTSPSRGAAAGTASKATSTSSPSTSASTIRYACRRTLSRSRASPSGSSPRAIARRTYAGSTPSDSSTASATRSHASA